MSPTGRNTREGDKIPSRSSTSSSRVTFEGGIRVADSKLYKLTLTASSARSISRSNGRPSLSQFPLEVLTIFDRITTLVST